MIGVSDDSMAALAVHERMFIMKQARFILNIVLAAATGITALLMIASLVLNCIEMTSDR